MPPFAAAFPIMPGQLDTWRNLVAEMSGPRKKEHAAARARLGVTVERTWLQHTPQGDMVVVYGESESGDMGAFLRGITASQDPFDMWFKEQTTAIHGFNYNEPPPSLPEFTFNYQG